MTGDLSLAGKVAVVTGSSRGIGKATALRLAAAGAKLIVHACQNRPAAEEVAREICRLGGKAEVIQADFAVADERERFAEQAWESFGGVDICVLCAGANILTGTARKLNFAEKLDLLWQVDVLGTIEIARTLGHKMKSRGQGTIVTFGWDGALRGMEGETAQAFAVAKGAVMSFSLSLAQDLSPQVRVNCVAPGWIRTDWAEQAGLVWQQRAAAESLVGRWGRPEEIAEICVFLASPAGSFINGQIIVANGGYNYSLAARAFRSPV